MLAFEDEAAKVPERATERMHFRTKPHIKRAIQHAAALSGVDDSAFTINAAYKAAIETIETHERLSLSRASSEAFFAALDNPPPPTKVLLEALDRHHRTVTSR